MARSSAARKSATTMSRTRTTKSDGKSYPSHTSERLYMTTYVDKNGHEIKRTRATTFERALMHVTLGITKYEASGAHIEHHQEQHKHQRALIEAPRPKYSRSRTVTITISG